METLKTILTGRYSGIFLIVTVVLIAIAMDGVLSLFAVRIPVGNRYLIAKDPLHAGERVAFSQLTIRSSEQYKGVIPEDALTDQNLPLLENAVVRENVPEAGFLRKSNLVYVKVSKKAKGKPVPKARKVEVWE